MHSRGQTSAMPARVQALLARHNALAKMIEKEQSSLASSDTDLSKWKREKLLLKDAIESMKDVQ